MKRPDKWDQMATKVLRLVQVCVTRRAQEVQIANALRRTDAAARREAYGAGYHLGYDDGHEDQMQMRILDAEERHAR